MEVGILAVLFKTLIMLSAGLDLVDNPNVKVEKGAPGTGISTTTRVFRDVWDAQTKSLVSREHSRAVQYQDGRSEKWVFREDGHTLLRHKVTDTNGNIREFTEYDDNASVVEHIVRDRNLRATVYVNVDVTKEVKLNVGDKLICVSLSDPWPGERNDKIDANKHAGLKQISPLPKAPSSLPSGAKVVDGFEVNAVSKGVVLVETAVTSPGFPGPRGRRPSRKVTTRKISVEVNRKVSIDSGIEGTVVEEPTKPGGRGGFRAVPLATIIIRDTVTNVEVARTTADANGKFELRIAAGTYVVEPIHPSSNRSSVYPRPQKQTVTVTANQWLAVTARIDTGIR